MCVLCNYNYDHPQKLLNKSVGLTVKTITCCVKAIHAVNAMLWHPGEQTHKLQTDKLEH